MFQFAPVAGVFSLSRRRTPPSNRCSSSRNMSSLRIRYVGTNIFCRRIPCTARKSLHSPRGEKRASRSKSTRSTRTKIGDEADRGTFPCPEVAKWGPPQENAIREAERLIETMEAQDYLKSISTVSETVKKYAAFARSTLLLTVIRTDWMSLATCSVKRPFKRAKFRPILTNSGRSSRVAVRASPGAV